MRKQLPKKHQNLERWIISYADFTTLLLATFVVMYAVSSINSSKFQEMAEAFSTAFMGKITQLQATGLAAGQKGPFNFMPSPVHTPVITRDVQVKNLPPALVQSIEHQKTPTTPSAQRQAPPPPSLTESMAERAEQLVEAYQKLLQLLGSMIQAGQVHVSLQSLGVVIDINSVLLFDSGKAELTPTAETLVDQVAAIIRGLHYPIQVNGFTDTRPIHNPHFDSNWDLSAARAVAVVKRFAAAGVDPASLVGAGYGEYHPVASNETAEGRAANRRVSIVVVSPEQAREYDRVPLQGPPNARPGAAAPIPAAAKPTPGADREPQ